MQFRLALLAALIATPATAWDVTREQDRMTDRTVTWAEASDRDARLVVGCLNGKVAPRLTWSRRIGYGDLAVSWRFDDGPLHATTGAMVSQDGRTLYAWIGNAAGAVQAMRAARRVRVAISGAVYDFLVGKGDPLPTRWGCGG